MSSFCNISLTLKVVTHKAPANAPQPLMLPTNLWCFLRACPCYSCAAFRLEIPNLLVPFSRGSSQQSYWERNHCAGSESKMHATLCRWLQSTSWNDWMKYVHTCYVYTYMFCIYVCIYIIVLVCSSIYLSSIVGFIYRQILPIWHEHHQQVFKNRHWILNNLK